MTRDHVPSLAEFIDGLDKRNPGQPEFIQAVKEVAESVLGYIKAHPKYHDHQILERMAEPDRVVSFRVCWQDDEGNVRVNRGYRVQNNNAIGPYKGGIRFHPSVNQGILKFLAFEQTFKNALTGLPMGGGKGGSNFNPKGKSDAEIMRFCQGFMTELYRHVGEDTDVPAGDIGVGGREIGYMFGQYKRITNRYVGVLTGKGMEYGGSPIRVEATGYGAVYFLQDMLKHVDKSPEGMVAIVSGSGNVAQHAVEKLLHLGAKPVTMSDSDGFIYDKNGIDEEKLAFVKELKNKRRGRIAEYAEKFGAEFHGDGATPWRVPGQLAVPCATQNEVSGEDAMVMLKNGAIAVSEGANMPCTLQAVHQFQAAKILFAPGKAANAGGVGVSGLEMSQNSARITWKEDELQRLLRDIMQGIHDRCVKYGSEGEGSRYVDYVKGANIAGFVKVADAMIAQGVV
ncbi:NADP-specific glutamate dehydrogenase [Pseudomarimonas arenosa]|uniref:Glutamate dehydrogenase n=1 Tax=Pseudomarimonas arenosa TaxID=2774145 RepID=A0AAW3ZIT5_9GAMM|nr:NADP-specific glutamate dehydrogenase [Pseudomarimonas arenosa]MBD8525993.1 NADP-specific glutamate dehydrogenase [Pseudomarimonas arenosa]